MVSVANNKNEVSSDYKLLTKLFFRLLPYQILLLVINAVNGIVDSLYASNVLGKSAMSAIGLYGPLNHFLYAASIVFVSGSQILYGRYLTKDRKHINSIFTVDIIIAFGLSLLTSLIMVVSALTNATTLLVTAQPDQKMLNHYLLGQAVGIPALVVGQQLFSFLSLENQTKRTMIASIVCFITNAIFNHVFVVILSMGIFGLGISSAISSWIFFGIMAQYYFAGKSEWKFSLKSIIWKDAPQIAGLGYPGALSRFVEMFRCIIVNFLVLKYVGSDGISSFAASNSLLAVIWAVPFGMVSVARMLFSISLGEHDRRSLVDVVKIVFTKGMMLTVAIDILLITCAVPLTNLFYHDSTSAVYHMTVMGFRILPLCMPLAVISLTFACYAQAAEKKILSIVLPIVDGMIGVVLFSFILIPVLKMNGLYIANVLNGVLCAIVIITSSWIEEKKFPFKLEPLMAIPKRFGVDADKRIDVSVRNMDEVVSVSERITDFCKAQGVDERRTYLASLCMEEMAGNVVEHGFSLDKKNHSVDIRVINLDGNLVLRIRDNCSAFNPSKRAEAMKFDEDGQNIGIKLVYGMAEKVYYQNLLGLNVLTIQI
ncbi:MAG: ATP-binding protein [Eubacterium sp.]|nr:ATP-binding protein [Eubacterium sp.]